MQNQTTDTGMTPVDRPLSMAEAADRWGIHVTTIYRNIKLGKLPEPIQICSRPRFTPAQVQAVESGEYARGEAA